MPGVSEEGDRREEYDQERREEHFRFVQLRFVDWMDNRIGRARYTLSRQLPGIKPHLHYLLREADNISPKSISRQFGIVTNCRLERLISFREAEPRCLWMGNWLDFFVGFHCACLQSCDSALRESPDIRVCRRSTTFGGFIGRNWTHSNNLYILIGSIRRIYIIIIRPGRSGLMRTMLPSLVVRMLLQEY